MNSFYNSIITDLFVVFSEVCLLSTVIDLNKIKNVGHFEVCCSLGEKYTYSAEKLVLGRGAQYTSSLFGENEYISRKHSVIEADQEKIIVSDVGSGNGAFVIDKDPWKQIELQEKVFLESGDYLMLSKECLCRVWSKWIPESVTIEEKNRIQKGIYLLKTRSN